MPAALAFSRQKQEDQGFKAKLSYMKLCFETVTTKKLDPSLIVSCRAGSSLAWAEKVAPLVGCLSRIHKTLFNP